MATAQWDGLQAVFEDLGGYGALARQAAQGEGPLVGHLQRTNIQLAAIPVFTRKGVAETTVNDLLEAARVSRRTFYKYFAGKLEVLESIYHSAVQLLLARFGGLRSEAGSDEDWLRAMVSLFFDYHLAVGPIIRMMQEEALHAGSPLAAHRQRAHLKIIELWAERLGAQGAAQGAAHDALTYRVLIWAMEAASLELLNASDPLELPRVKRVLGDLLVGTLCPSTQAPTRLQG
ncbi:TetR family transcriptional regulator [Pseudomonas aeruginosa]|uniref:TetR/AcrR family transcriptional regulator n=4 Tax=Pseudomonas aeruginosa TaxID=287 RepID=UPI0009358A08|nr:TetR/AcrR family transcriptional regulator [Pseudomonas aeruginosa]MCO3153905.1 TetR family transcriptional regulator [Pseudomonas aeruginosa]MCO3859934.1 TetR family transcriptional regulator [Pseudomonas aeruginosa]MCV3916769.1 TetR/AcrR family transcriptional regulator [Pseudomonas aeruginosa]MDC3824337.1 TetR family transcriptional regulator [Pseudomonas aeruginosa]MDC3852812.1 TetR family transcriptional regulator [Pseudomonas aeruginosa]